MRPRRSSKQPADQQWNDRLHAEHPLAKRDRLEPDPDETIDLVVEEAALGTDEDRGPLDQLQNFDSLL